MNDIKQKKVELLAPAGGMEQLIAAVENGADAVYIGGLKFNARMNAGNFSIQDIRDALLYAHLRGVKVFVTLNILIMDDELQEAVEYVAELYEIGVDAIIVQDIGLIYLIKKYIPNMEVHLSTQGSIYNKTGVQNALDLGVERVVLAREMSIDEIRQTTDLCDIEVFVHGAMCMCYSGQCQMSRAIGGRSGNRGECAQPCRLQYTDDKGNKGYFLSPKDMCLIDRLGELIDAGVASLKIEGRMKSPEYVATVVRIYRKYIDLYYQNGTYKVEEKDREELIQIFNRGGFTEGYFDFNPGNDLLSGEIPKHQGKYIGKVIGKGKRDLLEVELIDELQLGDGIEIRGKELTGNIITYIDRKEKGRFIIGDIKSKVAIGSKIFKTSSKDLMKKAKESYQKPGRKSNIGMTFTAMVGHRPQLTIYNEEKEIIVEGKEPYEKAVKIPMSEEKVKIQLRKTGDTPFNVEYITVCIDEKGTMPVAAINQMRREGLKGFEEMFNPSREHIEIPKLNIKPLNILCPKPDVMECGIITKGKEDEYISEHLKVGAVIINNLGWLKEFQDAGTKVYAGKGLNVTNGASQEYLMNAGVEVVEASQELEVNPQLLMVTEHPIYSSYIIDRKGKKYNIEKNDKGYQYFVKKS